MCKNVETVLYLHFSKMRSSHQFQASGRSCTNRICGSFHFCRCFFSLLWSCIDPSRYTETVSESKASPMVTITGSCHSTWLVYWTSALILYKFMLIACSFFLALSTKLRRKEFKTNNVIILSYILAVAVGLGIPVSAIVTIADVSVLTEFIVESMFVDTIIYICPLTLFLPSIAFLILEEKKGNQVENEII